MQADRHIRDHTARDAATLFLLVAVPVAEMGHLGEPGEPAGAVGQRRLSLAGLLPRGGIAIKLPQADLVADVVGGLGVVGQHVLDGGGATGGEIDRLAVLRELVAGKAERLEGDGLTAAARGGTGWTGKASIIGTRIEMGHGQDDVAGDGLSGGVREPAGGNGDGGIVRSGRALWIAVDGDDRIDGRMSNRYGRAVSTGWTVRVLLMGAKPLLLKWATTVGD